MASQQPQGIAQQQSNIRQEEYRDQSRILEYKSKYASYLDLTKHEWDMPTDGIMVGPDGKDKPYDQNYVNTLRRNENCEFDFIGYEVRKEGHARSERPEGCDQTKWALAEDDNPDPDIYDLKYEVGISALIKREEEQSKNIDDLKQYLKWSQDVFQAVEKHSRNTSKKGKYLLKKQKDLQQKLLQIMQKVEVMRCHGRPVSFEEQRLRDDLERIKLQMRDPEKALHNIKIRIAQLERKNDAAITATEIDEDDLLIFHGTLTKMRQGLQHLTDILMKDDRDLKIIERKLAEHAHNYHRPAHLR